MKLMNYKFCCNQILIYFLLASNGQVLTTLDGVEIENIVESDRTIAIQQQQQQQLQQHQIQEQHVIQTSGEDQPQDVIIDSSHNDSRVLVSYQGKKIILKFY